MWIDYISWLYKVKLYESQFKSYPESNYRFGFSTTNYKKQSLKIMIFNAPNYEDPKAMRYIKWYIFFVGRMIYSFHQVTYNHPDEYW